MPLEQDMCSPPTARARTRRVSHGPWSAPPSREDPSALGPAWDFEARSTSGSLAAPQDERRPGAECAAREVCCGVVALRIVAAR